MEWWNTSINIDQVHIGRCLLNHSGVPHSHWPDAFLSVVFIANRLPTPVLENTSPFQKLFNRSPDYSLLRTYGCLCFPLIPKSTRSKLDMTSRPSCFIGYVREYKGYKCLDLFSGEIVISRNVLFDEDTLPFSQYRGAEVVPPEGQFQSLQMVPSKVKPISLGHELGQPISLGHGLQNSRSPDRQNGSTEVNPCTNQNTSQSPRLTVPNLLYLTSDDPEPAVENNLPASTPRRSHRTTRRPAYLNDFAVETPFPKEVNIS